MDIARTNISMYSPQEIQNYAAKGLLSCAGVDLTEFVEKILEGMYSQDDFDKAVEEAEESSDELENTREEVRRAIEILENI